MESETLEQYAKRLADEIIEGKREFYPNEKPSQEARPLIESILYKRGYKAEFYNYANDILRIRCSEILNDSEQEETIGEEW